MRIRKLLLPISCFLLGLIVMYFYQWRWIINNKTLTEDLVISFRYNYDIQEKLKENYSEAYIIVRDILMNCIVMKTECNGEELAKDFRKVESERDELNSQLEKSNQQIEVILSKYPQAKN